MRTPSRILAALALVALLAAPLRAQQGSPTSAHDHSSSSKGGTALRPETLAPSGSTLLQATTVQTTIYVAPTSTFTNAGSIYNSSGSYFVQGSSVGANPLNTSGWAVISAFSKDGATQSSGCVVAVSATSGSDGASMQFTSSTTVVNFGSAPLLPGVLLETCAPLTFCRVGIGGIYRVFSQNASTNSFLELGTTRCQVQLENQGDSFTLGRALNSTAGAGPLWLWIGGRN